MSSLPPTRLLRLALVALLAVCWGCGATTRALTADPEDYARYRRTRLARSAEARLTASADYLDREPDGVFRDEVQRWFERAEPAYWGWAQKSATRLGRYLVTLPRGPHAREAAERIAELDLSQRLERQRDERVLEEALGVEDKLKDADEMRRQVVSRVTDWTRMLASIRSFGEPTSALHHETIFHFRLEEPEGRCADGLCVKRLALPFAIPDSGRLSARKALVDVELTLERGGVARARLAGPELWSRLAEASELRPVRPDDSQARAEAIARSVQIVEGALPPELTAVECRREAVSPVVLLDECRGVRVTMRAATSPELDDELVVEPVAP